MDRHFNFAFEFWVVVWGRKVCLRIYLYGYPSPGLLHRPSGRQKLPRSIVNAIRNWLCYYRPRNPWRWPVRGQIASYPLVVKDSKPPNDGSVKTVCGDQTVPPKEGARLLVWSWLRIPADHQDRSHWMVHNRTVRKMQTPKREADCYKSSFAYILNWEKISIARCRPCFLNAYFIEMAEVN